MQDLRVDVWWYWQFWRYTIESITSLPALHQIINESTHILSSSSSCIDLIFTNQTNMITDSGVHPSLHENCQHQIVFAKVNMKMFYLPPYKRLAWDYSNANIVALNLTIESTGKMLLMVKTSTLKLHYLMKLVWIYFVTSYQTEEIK